MDLPEEPVPGPVLGKRKKSNRRSSILKMAKFSANQESEGLNDGEQTRKFRRVSFATTFEVKEFLEVSANPVINPPDGQLANCQSAGPNISGLESLLTGPIENDVLLAPASPVASGGHPDMRSQGYSISGGQPSGVDILFADDEQGMEETAPLPSAIALANNDGRVTSKSLDTPYDMYGNWENTTTKVFGPDTLNQMEFTRCMPSMAADQEREITNRAFGERTIIFGAGGSGNHASDMELTQRLVTTSFPAAEKENIKPNLPDDTNRAFGERTIIFGAGGCGNGQENPTSDMEMTQCLMKTSFPAAEKENMKPNLPDDTNRAFGERTIIFGGCGNGQENPTSDMEMTQCLMKTSFPAAEKENIKPNLPDDTNRAFGERTVIFSAGGCGNGQENPTSDMEMTQCLMKTSFPAAEKENIKPNLSDDTNRTFGERTIIFGGCGNGQENPTSDMEMTQCLMKTSFPAAEKENMKPNLPDDTNRAFGERTIIFGASGCGNRPENPTSDMEMTQCLMKTSFPAAEKENMKPNFADKTLLCPGGGNQVGATRSALGAVARYPSSQDQTILFGNQTSCDLELTRCIPQAGAGGERPFTGNLTEKTIVFSNRDPGAGDCGDMELTGCITQAGTVMPAEGNKSLITDSGFAGQRADMQTAPRRRARIGLDGKITLEVCPHIGEGVPPGTSDGGARPDSSLEAILKRVRRSVSQTSVPDPSPKEEEEKPGMSLMASAKGVDSLTRDPTISGSASPADCGARPDLSLEAILKRVQRFSSQTSVPDPSPKEEEEKPGMSLMASAKGVDSLTRDPTISGSASPADCGARPDLSLEAILKRVQRFSSQTSVPDPGPTEEPTKGVDSLTRDPTTGGEPRPDLSLEAILKRVQRFSSQTYVANLSPNLDDKPPVKVEEEEEAVMSLTQPTKSIEPLELTKGIGPVMESPKCDESTMESSKCQAPMMESPKCQESMMESSMCAEATMESPKRVESMMESPKCGKSMMESPKCVESMMESPRCVESMMESPKCVESMMEPPKCQESTMESPKCVESMMESPKCVESMMEPPKCQESTMESPKCVKSMMESPKFVESMIESPRCVESMMESPKCVESMMEPPKCQESTMESPKCRESTMESPKYQESMMESNGVSGGSVSGGSVSGGSVSGGSVSGCSVSDNNSVVGKRYKSSTSSHASGASSGDAVGLLEELQPDLVCDEYHDSSVTSAKSTHSSIRAELSRSSAFSATQATDFSMREPSFGGQSLLSSCNDFNDCSFFPEGEFNTIDDYMSRLGIDLGQRRSYRRSVTFPPNSGPPESMSDFLKLGIVDAEAQTYEWACQQLEIQIKRLKEQSDDLGKKLVANPPPLLQKVKQLGIKEAFHMGQQLHIVCVKRARLTFKEWRVKMLKPLVEVAKEEENTLRAMVEELDQSISSCRTSITDTEKLHADMDQREANLRQQLVHLKRSREESKVKEKEKLAAEMQRKELDRELSRQKEEEVKLRAQVKEAKQSNEEASDKLSRLRTARPYEVEAWDWETEGRFTFLKKSLEMVVVLGDKVPTEPRMEPCRQVTSIRILHSVPDDASGLWRLAHNGVLRSGVTDVNWTHRCPDTSCLPEILDEISSRVLAVKYLVWDLELLALQLDLKMSESSVALEMFSMESHACVTLAFSLDAETFFDHAWQPPSFTSRIGKIRQTHVDALLKRIAPGRGYIRNVCESFMRAMQDKSIYAV